MEHARTTVVSKPAPHSQNFCFCGEGKMPNRGKFLQEALVVFENRRYASLLQHDLGNPDAVWVASFAPWQRARVLAIPGQEISAKAARRRWRCEIDRLRHGETIVILYAAWVRDSAWFRCKEARLRRRAEDR